MDERKPASEKPISERTLQRIQNFRLMDDLFMQVCFENYIVCVQLILRIILKKPDLMVLSVRTQHPLPSLHETRSLCLDVFAQDSEGRLYNLEIQRKDVAPERGRLHSALLDASALEAGEAFSRLPESWVIFIMERDPFGKGQQLHHFARTDLESGLPLNDGSHIVYVNGERRDGSDALSRLMHDFFCADPDAMYYELLAQVVRRFKQTSEGVRKMSSIVEEIRAEVEEEALAKGRMEGRAEGRMEGRAEGRMEGRVENQKATALQMLRMGRFTLEDITEITRLSLAEVQALADMPPR